MPLVEIKTTAPCPNTKKLARIAHIAQDALKIPRTSSVRVIWQRTSGQSSYNVVGPGQMVLLYCRSSYSKARIAQALFDIQSAVAKLTRVAPKDVLVAAMRLSPHNVVSGNGLWIGGNRFRSR